MINWYTFSVYVIFKGVMNIKKKDFSRREIMHGVHLTTLWAGNPNISICTVCYYPAHGLNLIASFWIYRFSKIWHSISKHVGLFVLSCDTITIDINKFFLLFGWEFADSKSKSDTSSNPGRWLFSVMVPMCLQASSYWLVHYGLKSKIKILVSSGVKLLVGSP